MTNQFTNEQVERATSLADDLEGRMTRQEWLPASLGIRAAALLRQFAAGVAPQAPSVEQVADTLATYHCRSVNPKADHPRLGYHAMSEDQREYLRERQRECAAEVLRMFAAPVQPSSTVDDLADEIGRHKMISVCNCDGVHEDGGCRETFLVCDFCTEAWPCLVDRLVHRVQPSRAVVEAIGGEGK